MTSHLRTLLIKKSALIFEFPAILLLFLEPYISTFQDAISPKAIELFQIIFHISFLFLSLHPLSIFFFFAITWNFNVAVNLLTTFPRQEPLKSKNKKHTIVWNTKFYHTTNVGFQTEKNCKLVPWLQYNQVTQSRNSWPSVFVKFHYPFDQSSYLSIP